MKALVKAERKPGLWLQEVPVPELGPNDLLVQVRKAAICGTDIHIFNWDPWSQKTIPVPMVIGHEFTGEVAAIGSAVTGFTKGERVSAEGHITCGHCRNCRAGKRHLCRNAVGLGVQRAGCFAEFIAVPAVNVFRVPKEITDDIAAFFDPLGNAVHTALSFDMVGEDVLITGAGPIGIMAAAIARHVGARHVVVTDVNDYRLGLARRMGASRAINVNDASIESTMKELGMTEGFDVGLEMSGNATALRGLIAAMNHGGRVDLVQDDRHADERPRRFTGAHPPLRRRGLLEGVRDDAVGAVGQSHPRVGVSSRAYAPGVTPVSGHSSACISSQVAGDRDLRSRAAIAILRRE